MTDDDSAKATLALNAALVVMQSERVCQRCARAFKGFDGALCHACACRLDGSIVTTLQDKHIL